jgi:hypothetical protein
MCMHLAANEGLQQCCKTHKQYEHIWWHVKKKTRNLMSNCITCEQRNKYIITIITIVKMAPDYLKSKCKKKEAMEMKTNIHIDADVCEIMFWNKSSSRKSHRKSISAGVEAKWCEKNHLKLICNSSIIVCDLSAIKNNLIEIESIKKRCHGVFIKFIYFNLIFKSVLKLFTMINVNNKDQITIVIGYCNFTSFLWLLQTHERMRIPTVCYQW